MSMIPNRSMITSFALILATACGGSETVTSSGAATSGSEDGASSTETASTSPASSATPDRGAGEFHLTDSTDAGRAHGEYASLIVATATEAAMRLFVVDPDAGPIQGIVVKLTGPDGMAYYTAETDAAGYTEMLVPAGARYDLEYLSLGRSTTTAHVDVPAGPNQDVRLTLRHRPLRRPAPAAAPAGTTGAAPAAPEAEHLVLEGVLFASDSANLEAASGPRLDRVVEYLTHHPRASILVAGHTDNVGNPRHNQQLSEARAQAVRAYLLAHGIDASRVEAAGFGDTQPVAPNDTEQGRARNRRIEAIER